MNNNRFIDKFRTACAAGIAGTAVTYGATGNTNASIMVGFASAVLGYVIHHKVAGVLPENSQSERSLDNE